MDVLGNGCIEELRNGCIGNGCIEELRNGCIEELDV